MKFQFNDKTETDFAGVLMVRDKLFQRFGSADFISGEMQFAENVPLSGMLCLNLDGLEVVSLSVECFLPKKEDSVVLLRQTYQNLIDLIGNRFCFFSEFYFHSKTNSARKSDNLSACVVAGRKSFSFGTESKEDYKSVMESVFQKAQVPARLVEENNDIYIRPNDGVNVTVIPNNGKRPHHVGWPVTYNLLELVDKAEALVKDLADLNKGIKCSWKVDTIMGGGTAADLVAILNSAKLNIPKGKLSFSYLLKKLEGLEQVRMLLGSKAKLSAQAAVFRWPEEDRGQLWVDTKTNGFQIQIHLDDADRIKELQDYLGMKFDSGKESFL